MALNLSKQEHERRLQLYNQDNCDVSLAQMCGVTRQAIHRWRRRHKLPLRVDRRVGSHLSEKEEDLRYRLHTEGLLDAEIASRCRRHAATIGMWRVSRNLPSNRPRGVRLRKDEERKRGKLYGQGLTDVQIGKAVGNKSGVSICTWRKRRGLPANHHAGWNKLSSAEEEHRLQVYKKGLGDHEMGELIGLSSGSVYNWRRRHNLPAHYKPSRGGRIT